MRRRFAIPLLLLVGPGLLHAQNRIYIERSIPQECARIGAAFREEGGGLMVAEVTAGAPADEAGLRPGDRVTLINGVPASLPQLDALVRALRPGNIAAFQVQRGGREHGINVVAAPGQCTPQQQRIARLEVMKEALAQLDINMDEIFLPGATRFDTAHLRLEAARQRLEHLIPAGTQPVFLRIDLDPGAALATGSRTVAGVELSELNPELARYFNGASEGLLILRVAPRSPGARGGLVPGDVVVGAAGKPVTTIPGFRAAIRRAAGQVVPIEAIRNGKRLELQLPLEP
jgi:S1-C subfamily serine protease